MNNAFFVEPYFFGGKLIGILIGHEKNGIMQKIEIGIVRKNIKLNDLFFETTDLKKFEKIYEKYSRYVNYANNVSTYEMKNSFDAFIKNPEQYGNYFLISGYEKKDLKIFIRKILKEGRSIIYLWDKTPKQVKKILPLFKGMNVGICDVSHLGDKNELINKSELEKIRRMAKIISFTIIKNE